MNARFVSVRGIRSLQEIICLHWVICLSLFRRKARIRFENVFFRINPHVCKLPATRSRSNIISTLHYYVHMAIHICTFHVANIMVQKILSPFLVQLVKRLGDCSESHSNVFSRTIHICQNYPISFFAKPCKRILCCLMLRFSVLDKN